MTRYRIHDEFDPARMQALDADLARAFAANFPADLRFTDIDTSLEWTPILQADIHWFRVYIDVRAVNWDKNCAPSCSFDANSINGLREMLKTYDTIVFQKGVGWVGTWKVTADIQRVGHEAGFEVEYKMTLADPDLDPRKTVTS